MKTDSAGEPMRTCLGCRVRRGQNEMIRLALVVTGGQTGIEWDTNRKLGGRGAWLCRGNRECLAAAVKRRAFSRAFRTSVPLNLEEVEAKMPV